MVAADPSIIASALGPLPLQPVKARMDAPRNRICFMPASINAIAHYYDFETSRCQNKAILASLMPVDGFKFYAMLRFRHKLVGVMVCNYRKCTANYDPNGKL